MRAKHRLVANVLLVLLAGHILACGSRPPTNPRTATEDKDKLPKDKPPPEQPPTDPGPGDNLSQLKITKLPLDPNGLLPCLMWADGLWIDNPNPTKKGLGIYAL